MSSNSSKRSSISSIIIRIGDLGT
uniref:Uncharacterized protein n=1 Tax=Lepeophtheirus salmonis TaxID=72036 RepID=A0A0K2U2T1_LEPSM